MTIPINIARQIVKNCLPQCALSESQWYEAADAVFVDDALTFVSQSCVTRCYEASKAAFQMAAALPEVASLESKKVVEHAAEELVNYGWWAVAATTLLIAGCLLYRTFNRQ